MATDVRELDLPVLAMATASERYDAARRRPDGWLAKAMFSYSVWRYEDAVAILRDRRWHNAAGRITELLGVTDRRFVDRRRESILSSEGETHTRLRRLVGQAFSPRSADRLRPFMRQVVGGLVDVVAPSGRADIVAEICEPYPIPVICELLGAPKQDWQLFSRLAAAVLDVFSLDMASKLDSIVAAQEELDEYAAQLISDRRRRPADDLITDLIAAEQAGDRLSTSELQMMVQAVIVGGTDTTRNQLGCAVSVLADHPDQWRLLADQPDTAPLAVEELMRYMGAVRGTVRYASEDIVYRDVLFPAGSFVSVGLLEANRDAAVFPDPLTLDITRATSTQGHLGFGAGIHYCLGQALARAELQEALPVLARRMPDLRVAGEVVWKPDAVGVFGPASLPVAFTPGR